MNIKIFLTLCIATLSSAIAECCSEPVPENLKIEQPVVRPSQKGHNTGAYMTIKLKCMKATDRLLGASCDACETVELHDNIYDNGISRMRPVRDVVIKDGELSFKPGGLHVMLMNLNQDLKTGDSTKITLHFEKAGPVEITYQVQDPLLTKNTTS